MVKEAREVMGEVFEDHEAVVALDHDFLEGDNVEVVEGLEEFDFAGGCHWELCDVSMKSKRVV